MREEIFSLITNQVKPIGTYAAIIGKNPSHGARSPQLWNSEYLLQESSIRMYPLDVEGNNFNILLEALSNDDDFIGGSIAAPFKEQAFDFLNGFVTDEAAIIKSVNNLYRNEKGELCGHNTDGEGFVKSFFDIFKLTRKKKCLYWDMVGLVRLWLGVLAYIQCYILWI